MSKQKLEFLAEHRKLVRAALTISHRKTATLPEGYIYHVLVREDNAMLVVPFFEYNEKNFSLNKSDYELFKATGGTVVWFANFADNGLAVRAEITTEDIDAEVDKVTYVPGHGIHSYYALTRSWVTKRRDACTS